MRIKKLESTPRHLREFPLAKQDEGAQAIADLPLQSSDIEDVVEIFNTPLTGAYNWDYTEADNRIRKLYELGKKLNWNASMDLNWSAELPAIEPDDMISNFWSEYKPFAAMSRERQLEFMHHRRSWSLSQFLHGEQGALLVASQLVSCAPTYNAKLYAASQTFDEARHVEVFNRYIQHRLGLMYPISAGLKSLLDKILTDPRWDLKFIGMQIVIEGLALAAFQSAKMNTRDPLLEQLLDYVLRDEARHVTFGVNYLEEYVQTLSEKEVHDRAQFAYEACVISRERLVSLDVYQYFGWDPEHARLYSLERGINSDFLQLLFARVIPNLSRIGLLTDEFRGKYEALGVLQFESLGSDADIDWADLSRPLDTYVA